MASYSYLRKKREAVSKRNSERGKLGNQAKARLRMERGEALQVVGAMQTTGTFGVHTIELLSCGDESHVWLRVDGELRQPRTCAGVKRIVSEWIWKKR